MRVQSVGQMDRESLKATSFDVVVCASGFEKRAPFLAQGGLNGERRIALGFEEASDNEQRLHNDEIYRGLGFEPHTLSGHDQQSAVAFFDGLLRDLAADGTASLFLDISSMTRVWYGAAVRAVRDWQGRSQIRTVFGYVPAVFSGGTQTYPQNRVVGPVAGFGGLSFPTKPVALLVGLGQEHARAIGICDEIDPGLASSFLARPASDRRYEAAAVRANADFLLRVPPDLRFEFPLLDFPTTFHRLRDVCGGLAREWRVVLAALGPKVFALSCFLVAADDPQISVWRVSAGAGVRANARRPSRSLILADVEWISENA